MKIFLALVVALFAISGCGANLEKQIIGSWKVDTSKTVMGGEGMKDEAAKKMAMAMMETVTLDIKEDKSFDMKIIFPVTGTWTLTGNKLALKPTVKEGEKMSFGGKDFMEFDVASDGNSMTTTMKEGNMTGTLVLVKSTPSS